MEAELLNLAEINREFRAIAAVKSWQEYHNPKNLAAAVAVEAGELLAEFQWLTPSESANMDNEKREKVGDEIADILMYLTELSRRLDINLADAVASKIEKNKRRFMQLK